MSRMQIPGNYSTVSTEAAKLDRVADALLAIANSLALIASETASQGEAMDVIRQRTDDASDAVRTVHPRYEVTSTALQEYAIALHDTKSRAASAISRIDTEEQAVSDANHHLMSLRADEMEATVLTVGDGAEELQRIHQKMRHWERERDSADYRLAVARSDYDDAVRDWQDAARRAVEKIAPALGAANDTLFDYVRVGVESIAGFVAGVLQWIADLLVTVLSTLIIVLAVVLLLVIVLALVLSIMFSFVGLLVLFGVIDFRDILALAIKVAMVSLPIILPAVSFIFLREAITPTPEVLKLKPYHGYPTRRPDDMGDTEYALYQNGVLDSAGGVDSTQIEITQVMGEDGVLRWRVTLPSTMDWQLPINGGSFGDSGAVNDLGSNIMLMMSPQQQAAYERAVLDAMAQAGIGPNDPVMLVGWSQGGILAGKLASTPGLPYNIETILVAGSPIDHMDIPSSVSVLSFQHTLDPVHTLDGATGRNDDNWATVDMWPSSLAPDDMTLQHGNEMYVSSVHEYMESPSDDVGRIEGLQSEFFSDNEINYRYGTSERDSSP